MSAPVAVHRCNKKHMCPSRRQERQTCTDDADLCLSLPLGLSAKHRVGGSVSPNVTQVDDGCSGNVTVRSYCVHSEKL